MAWDAFVQLVMATWEAQDRVFALLVIFSGGQTSAAGSIIWEAAAADIAGFLERCTEADCPGLPYFDITLPHRQQSVIVRSVYWLE